MRETSLTIYLREQEPSNSKKKNNLSMVDIFLFSIAPMGANKKVSGPRANSKIPTKS